MARTRPTRAKNLANKQRRFEKNYATNHGLVKTSARDYTWKYKKKQDLAETEAPKKNIHIKYIKDCMYKGEKMLSYVIICQLDISYMRITRFSSS